MTPPCGIIVGMKRRPTTHVHLIEEPVPQHDEADDEQLVAHVRVTFEADDVYDQADAKGFINLNALRIRGFGDDS